MEEVSLPVKNDLSTWQTDALERKPLADYLTKSLNNQVARRARDHGIGLTVALDADWGAGKTFFVREWVCDLRLAKHPVVYFDAWENDIGDEASIALMAAILKEVAHWKSQLPNAGALRVRAEELRERSVRKLRRAVIPVAGIVAKSLLKKATAIAVDELVEAIKSDDAESASTEGLGGALDKIFDEALKEHESRRESLVQFRASLSELLQLVTSEAGARAPLYVFIDELDRCRPTYAVKLLEEIKHIFGVSGVVYVVSTNLDQLQCSVKAIYGADFDGRRYLRRMFDREYSLPKADNKRYAEKVFGSSSPMGSKKYETGLPRQSSGKYELADAWGLISDSFNLDFRTQKQVLAHVEEAVSAIDDVAPVHALWLFYLCALFHHKPGLLRDIADRISNSSVLNQAISDSLKFDPDIKYLDMRRDNFHRPGNDVRTISLSKVLSEYGSLSLKSSREIFDAQVPNVFSYPDNLLGVIQSEFGGSFGPHSPKNPSIRAYASIVMGAGFLLSPSTDPA